MSNTAKSLLSSIYEMGETIRDNIYFKNLKDTPTGYQNEYLLKSTSTGIAYTSISDVFQPSKFLEGCAFFHIQSHHEDEEEGVLDLSIRENDVLTNVVHSTAVTPIYGASSMYFDGVNTKVMAGYVGLWNFLHDRTVDQYTIQCWVRPNSVNFDQLILTTTNQGTDHGVKLFINQSNQVEFHICHGNAGPTIFTNTNVITAETWHHIAITNNENNITVYVDGNAGTTAAMPTVDELYDSTSMLEIGFGLSDNISYAFNGYMQDVRIDKIAIGASNFPPETLLSTSCNSLVNYNFLDLSDTPYNYNQYAGSFLRVDADERGLEFVDVGLSSSSSIDFATQYLNQDVKSNQVVTDFDFSVMPGTTYRISSTLCFYSNSSDNTIRADFYDGDSKIVSLFNKGESTTVSNSMLFTAQSDNLYVSGVGLSDNAYIQGQPEISFVQLEQLPALQVTLNQKPIVKQVSDISLSIENLTTTANITDYTAQEESTDIPINVEPMQVSISEIALDADLIQAQSDSLESTEIIDSDAPSFSINCAEIAMYASITNATEVHYNGEDIEISTTPPSFSISFGEIAVSTNIINNTAEIIEIF